MEKPDINAIMAKYKNLSGQKVGTADILAQKKGIVESLKAIILKDRERGISIEDVCAMVREASGLDITDQIVREAIAVWEGRSHRAKKAKGAPRVKKTATVTPPVAPPIPANEPPKPGGLFGRQ